MPRINGSTFGRVRRLAVVLITPCIVVGCGGGAVRASAAPAAYAYASGAPSAVSYGGEEAPTAAESVSPAARASSGYPRPQRSAQSSQAVQQGAQEPRRPGPETSARTEVRMLVYDATLQLLVNNVPEAAEQAIALATSAGGFLSQRTDATVQLRVPVASFHDVFAQLERLGDVTHREIQVEDVSERFHDMEVQLANLRAVRERLQGFLARAANIQEALAVERELERVGAEIDRIEGQLRFWANRAALSTITLRLDQRPSATAPPPSYYGTPELVLPFPWLREIGLPRLLEYRGGN